MLSSYGYLKEAEFEASNDCCSNYPTRTKMIPYMYCFKYFTTQVDFKIVRSRT
jgi:hypothetical protein